MLRFAGATTGSKGQDISARIVGRGAWKIDALVYGQSITDQCIDWAETEILVRETAKLGR